jgi:hypothetical protein
MLTYYNASARQHRPFVLHDCPADGPTCPWLEIGFVLPDRYGRYTRHNSIPANDLAAILLPAKLTLFRTIAPPGTPIS